MNTEGHNEAAHLLDYWQILYTRKEIVIAVALSIIFMGVIITRTLPRVYSATAKIQVQHERPDLDPFSSQRYVGYDPYFLRTQFEIIRSVPIIEKVVEGLNLNNEFSKAYGYGDRLTPRASMDRTVELVRNKVKLEIQRDTDIIHITVNFDQPAQPEGQAAELAALTANKIALVFKNWTLRKARETRESSLEVLQQELTEQNRKIAAAEQKIYELRQKFDLTLVGEGDSGAQSLRSQISALSTEISRAQLDADIRQKRYERLAEMNTKDLAGTIRVLIGDTSLEPLISERQKIEIDLNSILRSGLGQNHPNVVRARAVLDEIDAKIDEKVANLKMALRLDYERAKSELDEMNNTLEGLKKQEIDLSASGVTDYRNAMTELSIMKTRRDYIEDRLIRERITLRMPSTSVEILEEARSSENPIPTSPNFALNIMLSVAAGVFFGVVLAFFVEYLDTSIKTVDDLEKTVGAQVIGIIPQKVRYLNDPNARSTHSEPYRVLRTNLKSIKTLPESGRTICICSPSAGEGKTLTTFNLAYVCAEAGDKVCLVDSDIFHPRQHNVLHVDNSSGLCNIIVGESKLDEAIIHTDVVNLDFVSSGRMTGANVHGLIDTDEMINLLAELKRRYDWVLLDSPPIIGVSNTSQLVRMVDGAVMVVQHRKYPRAVAKRAKEMVVNMGGNLLGCVLNNVNIARDYSSYYYKNQYYYYYPYTYSYTGKDKRKRSHRSSDK